MYNFIVSVVGELPVGLEFIYGILTIVVFTAFVSLLVMPLTSIFSAFKKMF